MTQRRTLYPEIEPYASGMLDVGDGHSLYWERCGTAGGKPVVFLHGGPGGGISPGHRRQFDPALYDVLLFDQRGCGRSTPLGETRHNTTAHLVDDIETLRQFLGIEKWLVFGGSWGATLGLAYCQKHQEVAIGLILRSVFLGTAAEVDWFFQGGRYYHPETWLAFLAHLTPAERARPLDAYHARLFSGTPEVELAAARAWCAYEGARVSLMPSSYIAPDSLSLSMAKLECHYFKHLAFLQPDELVRGMAAIRQLPIAIVHGRYDMLCPPINAFRLLEGNGNVLLSLVPDAGHSAFETGMAAALLNYVQKFKQSGQFNM